ncbi:MAG TPA: discoidin domain-containing protein [Pyrinomonadaceae bacterium]|nr:discoidin domain-containing protein [Pyrinomonadaceae bacterium]
MNRFVPTHAFGAALDGHEKGEIGKMLSPGNIKEMLTAGLKPLSYRLRTELAVEAWHWNAKGTWSEPDKKRGYWTSSSDIRGGSISLSYGYRLPRRGSSTDQANDDDYSRLDDGRVETFWKSNPYLDQHFTGEQNSNHPQWVVIDLEREKLIDAIRIRWAIPFARVYDVQYASIMAAADVSQALPNDWQTFPQGAIQNGRGGDVSLRLSSEPIRTRFIRILMKESSSISNRQQVDVRDHLGYAIREIYVGLSANNNGTLQDEIHHASNNREQTSIYVSSTDPWHRARDKDELIEQAGFDRLFKSHLTNGLPVLVPIAVLYNTPENAVAEIRYLKRRGYSIEEVELGEEPDGQFVTPEDYAALYIQFARALHQADPKLKLGGPSFQDIEYDEDVRYADNSKPAWLGRFLTYLKQHGRLEDYTFFSFEWYPFDNVCQPTAPQLAAANRMLTTSLTQMQMRGLTRDIPWIMTEYGYSAFGGRAEMDIEGALLNADIIGTFLNLGGEQTFLYGYEPNEVIHEVPCSSGNNMLFELDDRGAISYRMPTYYGARLTTQEWVQTGNGVHDLYAATVDDTQTSVTAYAVHRPDGLWALMILNKDPNRARAVVVKFHNETTGSEYEFEGAIDLYQYSRKQYELSTDRLEPYPIRDLPPEHKTLTSTPQLVFQLPAYSLTVIRGRVPLGER